jgi:hypothetical protein
VPEFPLSRCSLKGDLMPLTTELQKIRDLLLTRRDSAKLSDVEEALLTELEEIDRRLTVEPSRLVRGRPPLPDRCPCCGRAWL